MILRLINNLFFFVVVVVGFYTLASLAVKHYKFGNNLAGMLSMLSQILFYTILMAQCMIGFLAAE